MSRLRESDMTITRGRRKEPALPPIPDGAVMVTLKIARFNPEDPDAAGWQSFRVPCLPTDRLLNLLHYVKWYLDGTLTFRRSCAHGVCGSDAMRINGVNRLACKVLDARPAAEERRARNSPSPSNRSAACRWRRTSWWTWSRSSTPTGRSSRTW